MKTVAKKKPAAKVAPAHAAAKTPDEHYLASQLELKVAIQYGAFINTLIQFLIVAFVVFLLVKGITVDTVGTGADMAETLTLTAVTGAAKERGATVRYHKANGAAVPAGNHGIYGELGLLRQIGPLTRQMPEWPDRAA